MNSIKKNSSFNHEIIVHLNGNDKETEIYLNNEQIKFTKSLSNIGLCSGVNTAYKKSTKISFYIRTMICTFYQIGTVS